MANTIQIKRGTACSSALAEGELGYNLSKNILYIGNDGNKAIGGPGAFLSLSGGTLTGPLTTTQLTVNRSDNDYPTINFVPKSRSPLNSSFIQTNTNGTFGFYSYHSDQDTDDDAGRYYTGYILPEPTAGLNAENVVNGKGITYEIFTSKKPVAVAYGGTGQNMTEAPANALIRMSSTGTFWYTASAKGAIYAESANGAIKFGTLPIAEGGTGSTTAAGARTALGITPANIGALPTTVQSSGYSATSGSNSTSAYFIYKQESTNLNKMDLWADHTSFMKPVNIASGGTGATNVSDARKNLGAFGFIGTNPVTTTATDVTATWKDKGLGYAWYNKTEQLNNQPSAYGFLLNYVNSADIFQIWRTQSGGPTYWRSGNGSGWGNTWTKVYDELNKPTASELGVLPLAGGTMTGALKTSYSLIYNSNWPSLAFGPDAITETGTIYQAMSSRRMGLSQTADGSSYSENYLFPIPSVITDEATWYDILTTKNTVTVAQGGTGATTAAAARTNLGAVNKAGDTMTGSLYAPRLGVYSSSDYPTLAFKRNSDTEEHAFIQTGADGKFGFYGYNADQVDADTHFYEGYALPTPNTGLTANTTYSILTTKNAGQGLNSWVVKSHGGSINTTVDIFTLPPGIYHCEAATPISSNYPISEVRATIEIFGQYRTGTNEIATDGYQKGYWTIRITYAGGKQYMIQRFWDNWTSWRHIYNSESLIYNATEPTNKYEGRIWLKPIN